MRLRNWIYCLLTLPIVFSSCTQLEDEMMSDGGKFNITLIDSKSENSRSLPSDLSDELTSDFYLTISNINGAKAYNGLLSEYNSKQPSFKKGDYSISATLGENPILALDSPYYESEKKTASIEIGKVTDVDLVCYVANSLASFAFADPEQANEIFQSYQFVTKVGDSEVSCTVDDGKNPYFRAGKSVSFILRGTTAGGKVDYTFANISNVEKGKNYKYTLTLGNTETGSVDLDISVDESIEDVSVNETVPENWLPKPSVAAEGFNQDGILEYIETNDAEKAIISFQAYKPVDDIKLILDFKDPKLNTLSKTYDLSTLSQEDKSSLEQAGIVLPELNSTSGNFDFTNIIPKLLCADNGSSVDNRISVSVYANGRWSEEKEYTIRTFKPEFGVTVNENDFWTKTFSVRGCEVTTGNAETILANLKYQYSEDNGSSWHDLNNILTHKFDIAPDNKNLKVRALYRGTVPSTENDVILESPEQLPNSGMEEWREEIYKDRYYCFYPWNTDSNCHWDTNNLYTTRHRHNTGTQANYNGFHAVSYVPGRNGGLAAELRSTANGRGNTRIDWPWTSHTEKDHNKVSGELFLGEFQLNLTGNDINGNDSYQHNKTAAWNSRPTKLKFSYKYIPYNSDTWEVYVELIDIDENTIISTNRTSSQQTDWVDCELEIPYEEGLEYKKCSKLYIVFKSTINSGKNMPYREITQTFYTNNGSETKTFSPAYVGSVLTIDDISLVYDK